MAPPEAESIKSLLRVAGVIALVTGVIYMVIGAVTFIFYVGVIFIIFAVIDIFIYIRAKEISELIDRGRYSEAKDSTLTLMIIGLLLGGFIVGILLLIAYMKYDELIRREAVAPPPPL